MMKVDDIGPPTLSYNHKLLVIVGDHIKFLVSYNKDQFDALDITKLALKLVSLHNY
jgi:hypothetical protein